MKINMTHEMGQVPVTVLHLDGDLASDSYQQLIGSVEQAISDGARYILLDMAKVPYMSSAGIRAIYQVFDSLRRLPDGEDEAALKTGLRDGTYHSRRLKLLNPSTQVQKALSTAGIDMYVEIHRNRKKAVDSFLNPSTLRI